MAIAVDILAVQGSDCWVRMPRPDLGAFAAALTAYPGMSAGSRGNDVTILQVRACGDWLGSLLGRAAQHEIWTVS